MSKILKKENQYNAWNAVGYEGEPTLDITMMDVYEWEEEIMSQKLEIKERLSDLLQSIENGIEKMEESLKTEHEELLSENDWLETSKKMLHDILLDEGYPNGLYECETVEA